MGWYTMTKRGESYKYALDEQQIELFWRACDDDRDKVLVGLMMFEGLRVSEALHVRAGWIQKSGATTSIHIPERMDCQCWDCKGRGFWQPKSKSGSRIVPLVDKLEPIVTGFYATNTGIDRTRQTAWVYVKDTAIRAGISPAAIFPHALRATAATYFASKGFTATELCYMLGWSDIAMASHYISLVQSRRSVEIKMHELHL